MKKVLLTLLSISTVFFFISCGSKPAPEEEQVEAPVVEKTEPVVEDVSVEESEDDTADDEAAYAALLAQIDAARNAALEAGADEKCPDLLKQVDDLYESLKGENLKDNAEMLMARYNLLANYLKAKDAKDEIDENGFAFYAQKNYDDGLADLEKVSGALEGADAIDGSVSSAAERAYANFNTVLTVAYKRIAKEERDAAYEAKKLADSVKAGVSQKERYKEAADDFQMGDSLYSMQNPKKALDKYTSAKDKFTSLYNEVSEKRAAAQAAIEEAKKRVAESAEYAEEADNKAPITEAVEGIEDEDTVLLEEDEYEDPAEAEVEIAETIDDSYIEESEEETAVEETDIADNAVAETETAIEETEVAETEVEDDTLVEAEESEEE